MILQVVGSVGISEVHKKAFIRMSKKIMSQRSYSVNFNIAASGLLRAQRDGGVLLGVRKL